jgi:hypothetical protein
MKTSSLQLLPSTSHGTPSGNYDGSSLDFSGDRIKAASYYLSGKSLQTVAFFITDFEGSIKIQATLDSDPTVDNQWFDIYELPSDGSSIQTLTTSINLTGNYTWIRAFVSDFTAGTINKITLSY